MNEQIMFTVFYNPITKDIYRNQDGSVYDVYAPIIDAERGLYEELSKEGYILDGTYSLINVWDRIEDFSPRRFDLFNNIPEEIGKQIDKWL